MQKLLINKPLVENNGNKIEIRKKWIACRGNKSDKGNRGIKFHVLEDHVLIKVKDPWGKWVYGKAYLVKNTYHYFMLEYLSKRKVEGYGAVVSFKEKPMIYLQVPLGLYLKYFYSLKPKGYGLVAGFDLNSDRLNAVVINKEKKIIAKRTFWYSEVVFHGFPKGKA